MKAITANRLTDGRVIYRNADGAWTEVIEEAQQFEDEAAGADALAEAEADDLTIVGPYFIDVEERAPAGQKQVRETIRQKGPSAGSLRTGLAGA